MKILGIETSCDETAAAVVQNGVKEISSVVSSSKELHEKTGGVVPEVAARKQVEFIIPVLEETLKKSNHTSEFSGAGIDAIAVTTGPGLIGSLLVGVEAAKALALAWEKPLVPVNHLIGHIYANWIEEKSGTAGFNKTISFPAVVLVVSGGHTDLVLMRGHGDFEYLGGTLDDAAGEAFDKTARLLGLAKYLGGPQLSKLASTCKKNVLQGTLPRPMIDKPGSDFSFSGLKTSVKKMIEEDKYPKDSIACEFENAVVDVLVSKTIKAAKKYKVKEILLGGGVSANTLLRSRIKNEADKYGFNLHIPPLRLCTDNAIYIAGAAFFNFKPVEFKELEKVKADPSLGIMDF